MDAKAIRRNAPILMHDLTLRMTLSQRGRQHALLTTFLVVA
ncbi:MAG: hypothetical protein R2834_02910 [Rhodothermales bacterium]